MKFISRQSNYRIVLKHGQPAEPMTGRNAVPGMYVKFENGVANVENEELCQMMMKHSAFKKDFIVAEEGAGNSWDASRREIEPEHNITNIEYGHVGKALNPKAKIPLNREGQKALKEMAIEMAKKMAPELAKELLKTMIKDKEDEREKKGESDSVKDNDVKDIVGGANLYPNPTTSTIENKEVDKTNDNKID